MKLELQVTSLEPAQKLKTLGVKQNGLFYHVSYRNFGVEEHDIYSDEKVTSAGYAGWQLTNICSAFTVAELGEMLPMELQTETYFETTRVAFKNWTVTYRKEGENYPLAFAMGDTEADARAKCLIYLLENGLIKR